MPDIIKINYLIILLIIINISCYRDPISIDLSDFEHRIVIEAYITDQPGENLVRISRTVNPGYRGEFPLITGAVITIADPTDIQVQFEEIEPGIYTAPVFKGKPGENYVLMVESQGKKYVASSNMPQPLELHTINFENSSLYDNHHYLSCSIIDRAGVEDYFLLKVLKNGNLEDTYLYQDGVTDGEEIIMDNFSVSFDPGDES